MSVNSLPSFAQAFNSLDSNNALPPIMHQGRKRTNDDVIRVKDESPSPVDDHGAPPPSTLMPSPLKKRRVTVSGGAPRPLHIDVRPSSNHTHDQTASTPISPVVMGLNIQRDNPGAIEQVRNMISVKQKQQALIEQRRGSAAGLMSPSTNSPPAPDDQQRPTNPQPPPLPPPAASGATQRTSRRSPNTNNGSRRPAPSPQPSSMSIQQQQAIQQQLSLQGQQQPQALPPPPISFARRRAALMGGKKKPADIVISPREPHSRDSFQPSIQSAPPSQNAFYLGAGGGPGGGRPIGMQMALPRLPNIIGGADNVRRVAGNVPPTPTRLLQSMQAQQSSSLNPISSSAYGNPNSNFNSNNAGVPNRSPPASVPISTSLVPPTPTALHRPGYAGDKAAFLAPFEVFYDALNDSKQLKTWLGEQLQKSHALMQSLAQQQERMQDTLENLVEKRTSGMKGEMTALRRRVEDLEEALNRSANHQQTGATSVPAPNQNKLQQNGSIGPVPPEAYTFPPVSSQEASSSNSGSSSSRLRPPGPERRNSNSPGWQASSSESGNGCGGGNGGGNGSGNGGGNNGSRSRSPVYDARRMSMSASRHDPLPSGSGSGPSSSARPIQSPPLRAEGSRSGPLSRQGSSHSGLPLPMVVVSTERERERERDWERERRVREREDRDQDREREYAERDARMSDPEEEC